MTSPQDPRTPWKRDADSAGDAAESGDDVADHPSQPAAPDEPGAAGAETAAPAADAPEGGEATRRLGAAPPAARLPAGDEATQRLAPPAAGPAGSGETVVLSAGEAGGAGEGLPPAETVLPPGAGSGESGETVVLSSGTGVKPVRAAGPVLPVAGGPGEQPPPDSARVTGADPAETAVLPVAGAGGVQRYGPGVPPPPPASGGAAAVWHGGGTEPERKRPSRGAALLRRFGPAALVLLAALAYFLWQRVGSGVEITEVRAYTEGAPECDGTAEIIGLVRTNGEPGTIDYQWVRSDGTTSELTERLTRGQDEARLRMLWTFHGEGTVEATAELRITAPTAHTERVTFTYSCG